MKNQVSSAKGRKLSLLHGRVQSFNYHPKGDCDGFILKGGRIGIRQINFDAYHAFSVGALIKEGQLVKVHAKARKEAGKSDHSVYDLVSIEIKNHKPAMQILHTKFKVSGKIARINYSKRGEPNGAILENGEFIHTKRHGARKLKIGRTLRAKGKRRCGPFGATVIEASKFDQQKLKGSY